MKVSIGMNLQPGPWGGGNQFGRALADYLSARGHPVRFDLRDPDLDLILLAEPRSNLRISAYDDAAILRYLDQTNPGAIVVHRINECDERKGTSGVNRRLIEANRCADHTVFISSWLRDLFLSQGIGSREASVILNGSDRTIFHARGYRPWDHRGPLRLVTHHWGAGWLKGFDIYQRLDELLGSEGYRDRFAFSYIGNLPDGFSFRNVSYQTPLHGAELASALRSHHVYLTASQNEPGGHHQNEGACCGLPLLYRESGAFPECCAGFGIGFTAETFEARLAEMAGTYDEWVPRMAAYPRTAERCCSAYEALFTELLARRADLLAARRRPTPTWRARIARRLGRRG